MRALVTLLLFLCVLPVQAQENASAPLVVPFTSVPPYMERDTDGQRSGYFVELAITIGAEIGVPVQFRDASTPEELASWQATGETQLVAGIAQLPPFEQTNIYSNPVATEVLRLTTLAARADALRDIEIEGLRIGIVPPVLGSDDPLLARNTPVTFANTQTAFVELLLGRVDALLLPPPSIYQLAREAGLDGRITFIGEPIQQTTRHVALHESRVELLRPINEAIARMDADGRLEDLRNRYNITVPPPPPEVLTVGMINAPPIGIVTPDGEFSGYMSDLYRDLAERAGFQIQFVEVSPRDYSLGPSAAGTDINALLTPSDARRTQMDFSLTALILEASVTVTTANAGVYREPEDLAGRRVGILPALITDEVRADFAQAELVPRPTFDQMFNELLAGDFEAIIAPAALVRQLTRDVGDEEVVTIWERVPYQVENAPALRFGLGQVRERLDAVIPGYLVSAEYQALYRRYFTPPTFWTPVRIYGGLGAVGTLVLMMLGALIWQ